jgi:coatomer subunit beta'
VKQFDVSDLPIRTAKFIPRKRWIIAGADDNQIRIFNYNTSEKEKEFEAHQDYIRSISVHPTKPYVLTTSDDMTIKLWNWEKNWSLMHTYEGHTVRVNIQVI